MTRISVYLSLTVALCGLLFSQSAEVKPSFELADVHVSAPTRNPFMRNPVIRQGRYEIRHATMVDLIRTAYSIDAERVQGGPSWLEDDRFDVIAKAPPKTTPETAKLLLQALLTDRFKLTVHNDTRSLLAYGLKVGKTHRLRQSESAETTGCKFTPPAPPSGGGRFTSAPILTYNCRNMTMGAFAQALSTTIFVAPQYLNERVVADQTQLKGAWDFDLQFTPKNIIGPEGPLPGSITLFEAVEKLGLKLEPAEIPLPVIVVDSVNRKPTENVPDVAKALGVTPPPMEFEVAELKPTDPDFKGMRLQIQPGGRVNIAGVPLKFLIEQCWDVADDMLIGAPKWMEEDRYNIVAKAAITGPEMDIDDLFPMLRALVLERFKMKVHTEQRPATAYTLMSVKPKMKKADPSSRTKYKEGPASDGKDPRDKNPILARLVTCQNMTMAQFADKLKSIAPGYIHAPVLDATGLEGGYDFTLSFSPAGLGAPGRGGPGGDQSRDQGPPSQADVGKASDPTGAITLFEAIEKQLGLKLQAQKRPVTVLVIDHVEQKPIDN